MWVFPRTKSLLRQGPSVYCRGFCGFFLEFMDFFRFCHQTVPTLFSATWFALMKFPTLSRARMLNGSIKNTNRCYPLSPFPLESIHVRLFFWEVILLSILINIFNSSLSWNRQYHSQTIHLKNHLAGLSNCRYKTEGLDF